MAYPNLTVTFLGTGTSSGVPLIGCSCPVCTSPDSKDNRLRSSILVQSAKTTLVVDTTPDFRYQMLRVPVPQLDAVLFTHFHKDHIAGLDDIRAYNYFSQKSMNVFATSATQESLKREFSYIFSDKRYPGIPQVDLHTINDKVFTVGDIDVIPIPVMHMDLPVLGFRFGPFTYITDANFIDRSGMELIMGSDTLVLNALRKEKHISHFSLSEARQVSEKVGVRNTYLTHISHQLGRHTEINQELPPNVQLAYDGLKLHF